ncbi:unnamed protein product [Boreogadus saida]
MSWQPGGRYEPARCPFSPAAQRRWHHTTPSLARSLAERKYVGEHWQEDLQYFDKKLYCGQAWKQNQNQNQKPKVIEWPLTVSSTSNVGNVTTLTSAAESCSRKGKHSWRPPSSRSCSGSHRTADMDGAAAFGVPSSRAEQEAPQLHRGMGPYGVRALSRKEWIQIETTSQRVRCETPLNVAVVSAPLAKMTQALAVWCATATLSASGLVCYSYAEC